MLTISRKGDQLYSKMGDFPSLKLFPATDNKLYYRQMNASFEFELKDDKVMKTIYFQNGQAIYPKKLD